MSEHAPDTTVTTTVTTPTPAQPTTVVVPPQPAVGQPSGTSTVTVPNVTRVTVPAKP